MTEDIAWHDIRKVAEQAAFGGIVPRISRIGEHVGEVVRLIPKPDLERARLIQEARAIYERIFPPETPVSERRLTKD